MYTDPISDYLTRIRNAQMAGHRIVEIPASNLKVKITEILYDFGFISKYKSSFKITNDKTIEKIE
jgi:small subunit ribosomal protein S8